MKKIFLSVIFICFLIVLQVGCASFPKSEIYNGKKIKTALYIGNGSSGGGVVHIARLLKYSPQVELTLVDGTDLRKNGLQGCDLFVMPGGSSGKQMKSMGKNGVSVLREFVRNGGSYIGVCAGCHVALDRKIRARLLPYQMDEKSGGYIGNVYIDIDEKGAKILDIPAKRYCVRYAQGPIMVPGEWEDGKCETLALYKSSLGPIGSAGKSFYGTPAIAYGNFGKGKVVVTSFHPEYRIDTYDIFGGCFYAVTGLKLTPQIPQEEFRPLRAVYHYVYAQRKSRAAVIKDVIALEKNPEIAVEVAQIDGDVLKRADVVILGDTSESEWEKFKKSEDCTMLYDFMDKGGKVVVVSNRKNILAAHKNLIYAKDRDELIENVLDIAD